MQEALKGIAFQILYSSQRNNLTAFLYFEYYHTYNNANWQSATVNSDSYVFKHT